MERVGNNISEEEKKTSKGILDQPMKLQGQPTILPA